jgi:hypothetical protein
MVFFELSGDGNSNRKSPQNSAKLGLPRYLKFSMTRAIALVKTYGTTKPGRPKISTKITNTSRSYGMSSRSRSTMGREAPTIPKNTLRILTPSGKGFGIVAAFKMTDRN